MGLRRGLGRFYVQHGHDSRTSVEFYVTLPFIDPSAVQARIAVFQFSGKLKGIVNLIIFFARRIFTNKAAVMIGHIRSPILIDQGFPGDVKEANTPG
jgi:hypothetical protein